MIYLSNIMQDKMLNVKESLMTNWSYVRKVTRFWKATYLIYLNSLKKSINYLQVWKCLVENNWVLWWVLVEVICK